MRNDDLVRLRHMLDAATEAVSFVHDAERITLDSDRKLLLSLVQSIEVIGEAASRTSEETRKKFSNIPWMPIVNMRNRLIHAYFDINLDIVWKTVTEDLPPLIAEITRIIGDQNLE